jgi:hypothetical protein
VNCVAVFDAENIEGTGAGTYLEGYGMGNRSLMSVIETKPSDLNEGQAELINSLNKE